MKTLTSIFLLACVLIFTEKQTEGQTDPRAPKITTQPVELWACDDGSSSYSLSVTATSTPISILSYKWYQGTNELSGIPTYTSKTLVLDPAYVHAFRVANGQVASDIYCKVTNTYGTVSSKHVSIYVNTAVPLFGQPVSTSVCTNESYPPLTVSSTLLAKYQWQKYVLINGNPIIIGYQDIPGATGSQYTPTENLQQPNYTYRCIVTNGCGTTNSNAVTYVINTVPTIQTEPADIVACATKTATFNIQATASSGTIKYDWKKEGGTTLSTSSSLGISNLNTSNAGKYSCLVYQDGNNCKVTSRFANLTVNTQPVTPTGINATATSICPGTSVTLSVNGGDKGSTGNWYWYKGSTAGEQFITSGVASINQSPTTSTKYWVRAEGTCDPSGWVSVDINVKTVSTDPVSISAPSNVCPNGSATLVVNGGALGTGASMKWYSGSCGGTSIGSGNSINVNNISAATAFFVRAEGDCNITACKTTTISVLGSTTINSHPNNTTVCAGDNARFQVGATGPEPLSYKWTKNNILITGNLNTNEFIIPTVSSDNEGQYRCIVTSLCDQVGATSDPASLTILQPESLNLGPDKRICQGDSVLIDGFNYKAHLWSTGDTSRMIYVKEGSTITLTITDNNNCKNSDVIKVIEDPALIPVSIGKDTIFCDGKSWTLDAGSGYDFYSWSNGKTSQKINVNTTGKYAVEVGKSSTICVSVDTVQIEFRKPFDQEKLCIVTVSRTGKNLLVWEKTPVSGITSYNVYKETAAGEFTFIGNVPVGNLSIFTDNNSFPEVHSDKYKISIIDTCNNESAQSPYHKTIHLAVAQAVPSGYNLSWDHIEVENSAEVYKRYYIYRGPNYSSLVLIDSISSNLNQYRDLTPPSGKVYYQISAKKLNACAPTGSLKSGEEYNSSFSNVENIEGGTGINELGIIGKLVVFPNPFSDETHLVFENKRGRSYFLHVYDLTGKLVCSEGPVSGNEYVFNRKNLDKGCYIFEIRGDRILRSRVIIE